MDIFNAAPHILSRLTVLGYQLIWTARHKGLRSGASYLLRRLGLRRPGREPGSPSPAEIQQQLASLGPAPTFSLVVLAGEDPRALQATLASFQEQLFPPRQIILRGGAQHESAPWMAGLRAQYPAVILQNDDDRLLDGLEGDYFSVVYPGDTLSRDALARVAIAAGARDAAMIYADENSAIHGQSILKPDWSPDFLLSTDYITRAVFFSRQWAGQAGFAGPPCGRAALYDLALRLSEIGPPPAHLPFTLLTRSAAPENDHEIHAMRGAIQAAIQRRGLSGEATPVEDQPGFFIPHLHPPDDGLTSILIATHDRPELLDTCLESIFTLTHPGRFEVILVDHQSQRAETAALIAAWRKREPERFRCFPYSGDFNFSRINNYAAAQAKGSLLVLLNNDTEIKTPGWLEEMAGYACRPNSGAVGAVLEYPNRRIQHGGILMGVDDLAVHAFKDLPAHAPGYMNRLRVPSNFLAVTGACLMVRTELFNRLGGLSEDFAVAGGDIDFCLRIVQKGMYNIVLPHIRVIHHESATRGFEDSYRKFSRLQNELDLLRQRWPEYINHDPFYHPCLDRKGKFTQKA